MRAYLAGKMRGKPLFNFQLFEDAAYELRQRGWDIVSPHEHDIEQGYVAISASGYAEDRWRYHDVRITGEFDFDKTIREDIVLLMGCDAIILLPGWESSEGARIEEKVARAVGLEVVSFQVALAQAEDFNDDAVHSNA